jgi:hypothetical protein
MEAFVPVRPADDELFAAIWSQDIKAVNRLLASGVNPATKGKNDLPRQE